MYHFDRDNREIIEGSGGTYAHYWVNGEKFDLKGGQWNNMWVSNAYDIEQGRKYAEPIKIFQLFL